MITKEKCREISVEMKTALEAIAAKHGLRLTTGGGNFSASTFAPKVKFEVVGALGKPATFDSAAKLLGLPADTFGKQFLFRGRFYEVTGINMAAPRYPINAKRVADGKGFRFPVTALGGTFEKDADVEETDEMSL